MHKLVRAAGNKLLLLCCANACRQAFRFTAEIGCNPADQEAQDYFDAGHGASHNEVF